MRIAIVNWSSRRAGGAETYLDRLACALNSLGHETALFCELDVPADRGLIGLSCKAPVWCVAAMGLEPALNSLGEWHPEVIYAHGLSNPDIEARTLNAAPAVLFAHGYRATCISGLKTFKYPVIRPCDRRLGWQCLIHYYPHRCGGLSPFTMWSNFKRESRRLQMLHSYRAIITASSHMRKEYLKHGFSEEVVKVLPLPVTGPNLREVEEGPSAGAEPAGLVGDAGGLHPAYRLLFVGRMELLKGGGMLLEALPQVVEAIGGRIHLTLVGEGPQRQRWEHKAAAIIAREPRIRVEFTGWLESPSLGRAYVDADLLVVPSLWPEPFGLVGPEAGLHGLPAAAFDVGGISGWLRDGVSGYLAPGDPPTAPGLARAIVKCLCDPAEYRRLRRGALETAKPFSIRRHSVALVELFDEIIGS